MAPTLTILTAFAVAATCLLTLLLHGADASTLSSASGPPSSDWVLVSKAMEQYRLHNIAQCHRLCWYRQPCVAFSFTTRLQEVENNCLLHAEQDVSPPKHWTTHKASYRGIHNGCAGRKCAEAEVCVPVTSGGLGYTCLPLPAAGKEPSAAGGTEGVTGTQQGHEVTTITTHTNPLTTETVDVITSVSSTTDTTTPTTDTTTLPTDTTTLPTDTTTLPTDTTTLTTGTTILQTDTTTLPTDTTTLPTDTTTLTTDTTILPTDTTTLPTDTTTLPTDTTTLTTDTTILPTATTTLPTDTTILPTDTTTLTTDTTTLPTDTTTLTTDTTILPTDTTTLPTDTNTLPTDTTTLTTDTTIQPTDTTTLPTATTTLPTDTTILPTDTTTLTTDTTTLPTDTTDDTTASAITNTTSTATVAPSTVTEYPCENGGTLENGTCRCPLPYTGSRCARMYRDCLEAYNDGHGNNGVMLVQPSSSMTPFQVFCNFAKGGTTRIMRKRATDDFNLTWTQFLEGHTVEAGKIFFAGLENIHRLTELAVFSFHINLWNEDILSPFTYDDFYVGPASSGYSVNYSKCKGCLPDTNLLPESGNNTFLTWDRDTNNCYTIGQQPGWYSPACNGFSVFSTPVLVWPMRQNGTVLNWSFVSLALKRKSVGFHTDP